MPVHPLPGFFEPFSALTHLAGALFFLWLGIKLLARARGNGLRVFFIAIYVFCTVFLLSMSGVYHMLPGDTIPRSVLGRLDYAGIFTLIAGTHTPIQGLFFRGLWRWIPLALMWGLAITGIVMFSIFYHELPYGLGNAIFLGLGWFAGAFGLYLWWRYGTARMVLLVGGGVAYSVGAVCMGLGWPTLIPGVIGPHEIWHIAVLSAMAMHWRFLYRHAHYPTSGPVTDI